MADYLLPDYHYNTPLSRDIKPRHRMLDQWRTKGVVFLRDIYAADQGRSTEAELIVAAAQRCVDDWAEYIRRIEGRWANSERFGGHDTDSEEEVGCGAIAAATTTTTRDRPTQQKAPVPAPAPEPRIPFLSPGRRGGRRRDPLKIRRVIPREKHAAGTRTSHVKLSSIMDVDVVDRWLSRLDDPATPVRHHRHRRHHHRGIDSVASDDDDDDDMGDCDDEEHAGPDSSSQANEDDRSGTENISSRHSPNAKTYSASLTDERIHSGEDDDNNRSDAGEDSDDGDGDEEEEDDDGESARGRTSSEASDTPTLPSSDTETEKTRTPEREVLGEDCQEAFNIDEVTASVKKLRLLKRKRSDADAIPCLLRRRKLDTNRKIIL